jgi:hypothetical protein
MLSAPSSTSSFSSVCREINKSSSSKSCSCPDPESEVKSELNYLEYCPPRPSMSPKPWAGTESEISPGHYISSSFTLGMKVLPLPILPDFLSPAPAHTHAGPWSQDFKDSLQVTRLWTNACSQICKTGNGFRKWDFFFPIPGLHHPWVFLNLNKLLSKERHSVNGIPKRMCKSSEWSCLSYLLWSPSFFTFYNEHILWQRTSVPWTNDKSVFYGQQAWDS